MKVKIKNYNYEIIEVEQNDNNLIGNDNNYHWGICDYKQRKIFIMNDLMNKDKRTVLIHEVSHAFIEAYGFLQVKLNDEIMSDFIASYSEDILKIVNDYFMEVIKCQ
ncbi:MAG: hypothetical protein IJO32_00555 [Bacilli bacterium]|nr:hypothetical protein [Bacilli bacterium]